MQKKDTDHEEEILEEKKHHHEDDDDHCDCHDHDHEHHEHHHHHDEDDDDHCDCHDHDHEHHEHHHHHDEDDDDHCDCHDHDHEHHEHHHHHDEDDDECGCGCGCHHHHHEEDEEEKGPKAEIIRIIISAVIMVALLIAGSKMPSALLYTLVGIAYVVIAYDIIYEALTGLFKGHLLDENFLMTVASIGALILGEYPESIAVMIFYRLGELFEEYAVGKSRANIKALMDIRPDYANIEEDGELKRVKPQSVRKGSVIVVQPGERVPIDGKVISGHSSLDTAALTGESLPIEVAEGDEVLSGSINLNGIIKLETTKKFSDSALSRILTLVREASSRKTRSENFIKKFARVYTPIVCGAAVLLVAIPTIINLIMGNDPDLHTWVYRALSFLCVSCPCALVISIPLSFFAGIGCAGKNGILVKGSGYIEALAKAKTFVFDKTGTMTKGVFEVVGIHHSEMPEEKLIELAAYAESASSHPIAKSIIKAYNKPIDRDLVESVDEVGGNGIIAGLKLEGIFKDLEKPWVAVGNEKLMNRVGVEAIPCHHAGTIVHVAVNGRYAGHILITDVVKETAADAIRHLNKLGINDTVMLTGDAKNVADNVAKQLGISSYYAELLPGDKVARVEELIDKKATPASSVAFVGDGINDAPVLSRADVGIAMGGLGSDAAIEAADVVLMDDDPDKLSLAVKIARKTLRIAHENIYFAIGVKLLCLILTATGITGMWLAIFADVGVMALAVLNAMRALRIRQK